MLVGLPCSSVLHFDLCINYEPTPHGQPLFNLHFYVLAELVQAVLISLGPCYPHFSSPRVPSLEDPLEDVPTHKMLVEFMSDVRFSSPDALWYIDPLDQQTDARRCSLRPCWSINHKIWRNCCLRLHTVWNGRSWDMQIKGAVDVLSWRGRGHHCCFAPIVGSSVWGWSTTRKELTWVPTMSTCTVP